MDTLKGLQIKVPLEETLDELVRDVTKVGSIPKSQARDRIMGLIRSELQAQREKWEKACEEEKMVEYDEREESYNYGLDTCLNILRGGKE